jgi:ketosteroid isomerase-like protein
VSSNLDLVRSIFAAWERNDFSATEWADPDIEYVGVGGPSPGSWSGLAGLVETWRDFLSTWKDFRIQAEEYREIDGERVLVLVRNSGRGKTSGIELGQMRTQVAYVFHVRDGRVTRFVTYWDRERALADLGLTPETG